MVITISEFAEARGIDNDTVTTYIRRHKELSSCMSKKGRYLAIDTMSEAYKELDRQYPLPKPIEVLEDKESRLELIRTQKLVISLQNELREATVQIAQADAIKLLLDDKEAQLEQSRSREQELNERVLALTEELAQERSKTWWDKLTKREPRH